MEIGPALPPHLAKKLPFSEKGESVKDELELETGVSTNQRLNKCHKERERVSKRPSEAMTDTDATYGPLLPPEFEPKFTGEGKPDQLENKTDQENDDDEFHGPALPPGFQKNNEDRTFKRAVRQKRSHDSDSDSDDGDYDVIGPMPPVSSDIEMAFERTKLDIEARSQATKEHMMGKKEAKPKRETWMTELPPDLSKNFGLGPRKFRTRIVELGDQSVWTDTPSEKARKEGAKCSRHSVSEVEPKGTTWELKRDHNMGQQVENYNKRHRGESLLDMHKKKLKKEKQEQKNKAAERRPFDREKDLNVPSLTAGQKKSIIEKSKKLGSRFCNAEAGSSYL